jgi:AcrR family transcriptional regulator
MTEHGDAQKIPGTEERLLRSATALFADKWYGTVSVAEVCRAAGLSNGVFYKYFVNKEELFKKILGRILDLIAESVLRVAGATPAEKLRSLTGILVRFSQDNPGLVSVFREGQYRFFEYEQRLVRIYMDALASALGRSVELPEYVFALGGIRFSAIRHAFHQIAIDVDNLYEIVSRGLFPDLSFNADRVFRGSITPLPFDIEPDARERLLSEGKILFGKKGFFETNIHEVTDAAGLSVGAFYTHFESKESFYAELIDRVGREVRHFISINMGAGLNRLEREMRGIWLFTVLLSIDKNCYNIVREAEFVLPEKAREYYQAFVDGYLRNPEGNGCADERTAIEFLLGVAHYFGLEVAFDDSPGNARAIVETIGGYLVRGFSDFL